MSRTTAAVLGPGAIGLTVAAALSDAGVGSIAVLGRTPSAAITVSGRGMRARVVDISCTGALGADLQPVDWLFLCVKAHQVEDAAPSIRSLVDDRTQVVILQNGVEHISRVQPFTGAAALLPGVVWFSAARTAAGSVEVHTRPIIMVPSTSPHEELATLLGSDVDVVPTDDFLSESWRKLCRNAVGGLLALTGLPTRVFQDPGMAKLAGDLACECIAVANASGAVLDEAYGEEIVDSLLSGPPEQGNSMLADRLGGHPLEWDARNGVICRMGRRCGTPTPISDVLVPLLAAINT